MSAIAELAPRPFWRLVWKESRQVRTPILTLLAAGGMTQLAV